MTDPKGHVTPFLHHSHLWERNKVIIPFYKSKTATTTSPKNKKQANKW